MKYQNFQSFLEEEWMMNHAEGQTKDDSIEATERWIENLDVQELIDLADKFADIREEVVSKQHEV